MNSVLPLLSAFGALSLSVGAVLLWVGIRHAPEARETEYGFEVRSTPAAEIHDVTADHAHLA